jgi:uncharacterized protein YdeI (YjbR/CyaY-like superfamily)
MTPEIAPDTFCPASPQHWREWLQAHHAEKQSVWLIYHKQKSATPSLTWSQAVDEALCFGWIDSRAQPLDDERYRQFFSRRKPGSGWSKINKAKVERLIAAGLMAPAGFASIETAKQNGAWTLLDDVEELRLPADLAQALQARPLAARYFESLSRTDRRNLLQWLVLAKRPATRQKRMVEIVDLAAQQLKPAQFRSRPR